MMYWSDVALSAGMFGSVRIGATTLPPEGGPPQPVSGPKKTKRRTTAPKRRKTFTTVSPFQKSAPVSQSRRYRMMSLARGCLQPYDSIDLQPPARSRESIARHGLEELVPVSVASDASEPPANTGQRSTDWVPSSSPFAHHDGTEPRPDPAGHGHCGRDEQ